MIQTQTRQRTGPSYDQSCHPTLSNPEKCLTAEKNNLDMSFKKASRPRRNDRQSDSTPLGPRLGLILR